MQIISKHQQSSDVFKLLAKDTLSPDKILTFLEKS